MNELIQKIVERTGISQDQAQKAVETVAGFLKERLPGPIAGHLDSVLGHSDSAQGGSLGDAAKGLGSKFGL
jgi:hypothetical protein